MKYPHLTRILSAQFPKLKLDGDTQDLDKIGGIIIDGKLMSIEEFLAMKNPKVNGDLDLNHNQEIASLPEGLEVSGSLLLYSTSITSLPEGLKVGGYLDLSNTKITSLPEGLEVAGSLWLNDTPITSLPQGLEVGGSLYLRGTKITSLPDDLKVKEFISVDNPSKIQCSEELRKKLL